jgi:hypothetical protein
MVAQEGIWVCGVKYPEGDRRCPDHPSKPGGPLVRRQGTDPRHQQYIGWSRQRIEPGEDGKVHLQAVNEFGDVLTTTDFVSGRRVNKPLTFRWAYDPKPVLQRRTPDIMRALRRGDIREPEATPPSRSTTEAAETAPRARRGRSAKEG